MVSQRAPVGVSFAARLAFERISHAYSNGVPTLKDVSLTAEPGEVLCLLGPSGSGKSTLLRIASGIEAQTAGRVLLNDREIAGPNVFLPPEQRSIGLVFQDFALFPHMNILQNVRFGLTALSPADAEREARNALARVGMEGYAKRYPHVLSGGEQQRVALARALVPRPAVLLMDEPFSGLDSRLKDSVRAETLAALRQSRATAIVVTHDAEEAMRLGDRIALMRAGRIVQCGTSEELFRAPADLFTAGFFSELNVFRSVAASGRAATPLGEVAAPFPDGTALDVAVRITGIVVSGEADAVAGRVTARRFLGDEELLEIAVDGAEDRVRARLRCGTVPAGARDIAIKTVAEDVLVFETGAETA
ncbi:MAG: ABC transporter ATP-binding protein [Brucellaceae bacterium]|nr:ABC transporter ATP-binding protein [Brucellaceae bacterium]